MYLESLLVVLSIVSPPFPIFLCFNCIVPQYFCDVKSFSQVFWEILLTSKNIYVILWVKDVIILKSIGESLKSARGDSGKSVKEVLTFLENAGFKTSQNTIYNWENGVSQPAPEVLLHLCTFYKVENILSYFGYEQTKKSPTPSNDDAEDELIHLFYEFLVKSGCIKNGDELTLLQAEMVAAMIRVIKAAFSVEEQHFIG